MTTRATPVSEGHNEGMNFGNMAAKSGSVGGGDHVSGSGTVRKLECWRCGREHMKKDFPKRAKEKKKKRKYGEGVNNKHIEVMGGS